jgi:prepilin-type processing-associated H-X9-DG protein
MKRRVSAFSILEILLTCSLMAILVGMLFPVFQSSRETSRAVKCLANLRQIGVALTNYASDNRNFYPPANNLVTTPPGETPASTADGTWIKSIWEYSGYSMASYQAGQNDGTRLSKSDNIFVCPDTKLQVNGVPNGNPARSNDRCYGMNVFPSWLYYDLGSKGKPQSDGRLYPMNKSWINNASSTAIILETTRLQTTPDQFHGPHPAGDGLMPHRNKSNVLFSDGHVEAVVDRLITSSTTDPFWSGK